MLRPLFRKWCIMFKKILKGIRNAELIIAGILFSTALVVLTLNVIFRRNLGSPGAGLGGGVYALLCHLDHVPGHGSVRRG